MTPVRRGPSALPRTPHGIIISHPGIPPFIHPFTPPLSLGPSFVCELLARVCHACFSGHDTAFVSLPFSFIPPCSSHRSSIAHIVVISKPCSCHGRSIPYCAAIQPIHASTSIIIAARLHASSMGSGDVAVRMILVHLTCSLHPLTADLASASSSHALTARESRRSV